MSQIKSMLNVHAPAFTVSMDVPPPVPVIGRCNALPTRKAYRNSVMVFHPVPEINTLHDLVVMARTFKLYRTIDGIALHRLSPYLDALDAMIGMNGLKTTLLEQILYYIQNMHRQCRKNEYLHTLLTGPPGTGKCLAYDTQVRLYNGRVKATQDIEVDDLLMGDDLTPRTVQSTCSGMEKMYTVYQSVGESYTVNESHILTLVLVKEPTVTCIQQEEETENTYTVLWFDKDGEHVQSGLTSDRIDSLPQVGDCIDISVREYNTMSQVWKRAYYGYKISLSVPHQTTIPNIYETVCNTRKTYELDNAEQMLHVLDSIQTASKVDWLECLAALIDTSGMTFMHCPVYKLANDSSEYVTRVESMCHRLALRTDIVYFSEYDDYEQQIIYASFYIYDPHYVIPTRCVTLDKRTHIPSRSGIVRVDTSKGIPPGLDSRYPTYHGNEMLMYPIEIRESTQVVSATDSTTWYYGFELDGNGRFLLADSTVTHNTSVAHIIADIYREIGILPINAPFKVAHREDFVAGYVGQTAIKTRKLLESCIGGVLFIDEAYSLGSGSDSGKDAFSKEAVDTLTSFLSEHKNDFCCIAAGYKENIRSCLFSLNVGLESRFQWVHCIEPYTSKQLAEMVCLQIIENNWAMTIDMEQVDTIIKPYINTLFKHAGRDVENYISKCKMAHARRVVSLPETHRYILTRNDMASGLDAMLSTMKESSDAVSESVLASIYA